MIDSRFSLRSDHLLAFIARLKHTNSGKKASCARQNAAFTPRKSIRSTIIRYDIGFRTTLQKTTRKKQKITCSEALETGANRKKSAAYTLRMSVFPLESRLGNAQKQGQIGKNRPPFFWRSVFPLDSRLGNAQKQGQIGKNRPPTPFGCPFFHSNTGSEMLGAGANPKNRSLPFRMSFFPLKSRIIG